MKTKHLIICDGELPYANSLMENIIRRDELSVRVSVCTGPEKARILLQEQAVDMVLVTEDWAEILQDVLWGKQVAVLSENRYSVKESSYQQIFKYQCADQIVAALFEQTGVYRRTREEKQKMLAVCSPVGRCGKTTLAMGLAREYGKTKQALYLNLEMYPGMYPALRDMAGADLGDFLYYIRQDGVDPGLRLSAMVRKDDGISYLAPIGRCTDLQDVSPEEWMHLFKELGKSNYDFIILDIGEGVQGFWEIFGMCDRIYMPVLQDEVSNEKIRCFEEELTRHTNVENSVEITKVWGESYSNDWIQKLLYEEEHHG